jgi:hypothetical protein
LATTPPTTPPAPPAPTDPRDEAFLREVDEAYRQDELTRFWKRYGRWLLLLVGVGILAFGGWLLWQAEQQKANEARAEEFAQALDKLEGGDSVAAVEAFGALESGPGTYATLATLMQAAVATQGGDRERALGAYRGVAADARAPQPMRDVATFKALRLEFDELAPDEVLARLKPYLEGDSPWAPAAAEMAALAQLKAGRADAAGALFLRVAAHDRAPTSMRARAEQMAAALGQDTSRIVAELERGVAPDTAAAAAAAEVQE